MKPLNPIMAVLAIVFAAFPLRALVVDGKDSAKDPVKAPVGVAMETDDKNSITRLTEILAKDPAAVKDAGERISDFLLNAGRDGSFVAGDVDTKAIKDVAQAWAKAQKPGDLAMLYFVVGTGDTAPSWVTLDALLAKTVAPKRDAEGRLRDVLKRFTVPVPAGAQISKNVEKAGATGFLGTALKESKTIFDRRSMAAVDDSVARNNTTAPQVPNTTRAPGSGFDGAAREYTFDDLYINGAVIKEVSGPNDANSRKISMKVYTRRVNGVLVNEIGIFDITDSPDDIFGQRFPIGTGKQEFVLDDRKPGHKKYVLEFGGVDKDGNRAITFSRPDGKTENSAVTSVKDLFNKRADQAESVGNIVKVGGEEFYVLPQGGARTALALFPKAMIDARRTGANSRLLEPALFAEVGKVGANGRNQNVSGKPHLGTVGKTDFHLEFNKDLGVWEAKEGAGDPPEPPAKPEGGAPGTTPGGTTPGGTTPGGGNNKPELAIADLEKLLLLDATCRKYDEDTSLISADLKGKYGMIMCNPSGKPGGDQAILLVPKKVWDDQQMIFKSIKANDTPPNPTPAATLIRGRIVDHYVVLQFDTQVQYLDLLKKTDNGFELAGLVSGKDFTRDAGGPPTGEGDRPGMNNLNMFMDALRFYMGVPANSEVFTEVPKRIKTEVDNAPLDLQAKYSNEKVLLVIAKGSKGEHFTIWPKVIRPSAPGSNQYAHLGGPANVFEPEVSSMDAPFEDKVDIVNSYQLVRVGKAEKGEDIVLYKATDPTGKDKAEKYYLSFKYKGVDTANADPASAKVSKIFKQKHFEAFNDDNPLPENRAMKGLTDQKDAIVRGQLVYRYISGTTKAKGVLAVFQNAAVSGEGQKDAKQNCIGPIVWWGLSNRAAAMKVCSDDKF